ncbi:MAG: hypothetical protein CND83_02680 [Rhodothermaeota bacterium MED-G19]|nr:MAG: hypothetical protein CND83_02680 [Rhodothermaeota bacterium MED-G19]
MKNKLQYLIIGVLIISNIFFIFNSKNKSGRIKNEEFRREMNYLSERIGYNKEQLELAKEEYKRYDSIKRKIERRFRRFDLIIMDDVSRDIDDNSINMSDYYDLAVELNTEKLNHWIKIREIANEDQVQKLDSIWSRMKERIRSN